MESRIDFSRCDFSNLQPLKKWKDKRTVYVEDVLKESMEFDVTDRMMELMDNIQSDETLLKIIPKETEADERTMYEIEDRLSEDMKELRSEICSNLFLSTEVWESSQ